MMETLEVTCADDALVRGMKLLESCGQLRDSRNGQVLVAPGPVTTEYVLPANRVLFNPVRDANPFFHLYEALWMLAGRNDVNSVAHFVKRMADFSDDGYIFNAAYGYRWRNYFARDQLGEIIKRLQQNPDDRRCVLTMWDGFTDLNSSSKDVPCNTQAYFNIRSNGELDLTVTCRSNDIIWGAYGANLVHMSILHEYVALLVGVPMGTYYQVSNDWHAYVDVFHGMQGAMKYEGHRHTPYPGYFPLVAIGTSQEAWDLQCCRFVKDYAYGDFEEPFFQCVAQPMMLAHDCYKDGEYEDMCNWLDTVAAPDWQCAAAEWFQRRMEKKGEEKWAETVGRRA